VLIPPHSVLHQIAPQDAASCTNKWWLLQATDNASRQPARVIPVCGIGAAVQQCSRETTAWPLSAVAHGWPLAGTREGGGESAASTCERHSSQWLASEVGAFTRCTPLVRPHAQAYALAALVHQWQRCGMHPWRSEGQLPLTGRRPLPPQPY
jgi:hypothetical protein